MIQTVADLCREHELSVRRAVAAQRAGRRPHVGDRSRPLDTQPGGAPKNRRRLQRAGRPDRLGTQNPDPTPLRPWPRLTTKPRRLRRAVCSHSSSLHTPAPRAPLISAKLYRGGSNTFLFRSINPWKQALRSLWLPIIVSGIALFFASLAAWMLLPHHKPEWKGLPNEDAFLQALRSARIASRPVHVPVLVQAGRLEKRRVQTPSRGRADRHTHRLEKPPNMGVNMLCTVLFFTIANFVIAYLAGMALPPGDRFSDRVPLRRHGRHPHLRHGQHPQRHLVRPQNDRRHHRRHRLRPDHRPDLRRPVARRNSRRMTSTAESDRPSRPLACLFAFRRRAHRRRHQHRERHPRLPLARRRVVEVSHGVLRRIPGQRRRPLRILAAKVRNAPRVRPGPAERRPPGSRTLGSGRPTPRRDHAKHRRPAPNGRQPAACWSCTARPARPPASIVAPATTSNRSSHNSLAEDRVPDCPQCGGRLKHATISFGQMLPPDVLMEATRWSREADLMLAIGSSLVVTPAADLPRIAKERGAPPGDHQPRSDAARRDRRRDAPRLDWRSVDRAQRCGWIVISLVLARLRIASIRH